MKDWLPHKREGQLNLSQLWQTIITTSKASAWGIPSAELTALRNLTTAAEAALAANQPPTRSTLTAKQCDVAFKALIDKMRLFKAHYFLLPPLTEIDIVSLGLKPKDTKPTPIPVPLAQAVAEISYLGAHQLQLHLHREPDSPLDPHGSDYGYRIYSGVSPPGGASQEDALGEKRELMHVPLTGKELPHSRFTRRHIEIFDFEPEDSDKIVYFCVRYENAKGEAGPWGPLFHAVIP
jgi:hypothetical protein